MEQGRILAGLLFEFAPAVYKRVSDDSINGFAGGRESGFSVHNEVRVARIASVLIIGIFLDMRATFCQNSLVGNTLAL
jgi:hypothetical protein